MLKMLKQAASNIFNIFRGSPPAGLPECFPSAPNPTEMGSLECKDTPYDEKAPNRMQKLAKTHPSRCHQNVSTAKILESVPSSPRRITVQ